MYPSLLPPESSRWFHNSDGAYAIDWGDPKVQEKIRGTVDFLIKGYTCKKGCSSNRCSYHKKGLWTSSSRDAPARKNAVAAGATRREATVALGVSAKGV